MRKYIIATCVYLLIGIIVWRIGYIEAPLKESILYVFLCCILLAICHFSKDIFRINSRGRCAFFYPYKKEVNGARKKVIFYQKT